MYRVQDRSTDIFVTHRAQGFQDALGVEAMRLASQKRILRAGDDPVGLAVSDRIQVRADALGQAARNLQDGVSVLQIADGGLGDLHTILQRIRFLAVQAANDHYVDSDRQALQKEVDEMIEEIDRQTSTVQFNGIRLLRGALLDDPLILQAGSDKGDVFFLALRTVSAASLGVDVLAGNGITTRTAAASALSILDAAIEGVSNARAPIGAELARITKLIDSLGVMREDQVGAASKYRDLDFAEGIIAFERVRTLQRASISAVRRLGTVSEGVLALLR